VHIKAAPRRSTGPDLLKVFLGSEGTLGIITAAVLRIARTPQARIFAAFRLPSLDAALGAARAVLRRGIKPAAMRIYDAQDAQASGLASGSSGTATGTASTASAAEMAAGEGLLLATMAGPEPLVEVERKILSAETQKLGGSALPSDPAEKWWRERASASALTTTVSVGARFPIAAPLAQLGAVYRSVRASLLAQGQSCSAFLAHFHEDGGCVYFSFPRGETADAICQEAALAAGGRPPWELGVDAPLEQALIELKRELDPHGILSGGRLVASP
jgi:alkyldihydroxyacetonephosphate synthase